MNRRWVYLVTVGIVLAGMGRAGAVSLQDASKFPELYAGSYVVVEGVSISGAIRRDEDFFCLDVAVEDAARTRKAQENGEWAPSFLSKQRATFVVSPSLAREMTDEFSASEFAPVKLRCMIEREEVLGNVYWLAKVCELERLNKEGQTIKTLGTCLPTPTPTAAPTSTALAIASPEPTATPPSPGETPGAVVEEAVPEPAGSPSQPEPSAPKGGAPSPAASPQGGSPETDDTGDVG
jgi:hypothetical protein